MRLSIFSAGVASVASVVALLVSSTTRGEDKSPRENTGTAVVELFTSEGCSSCPPADALLADLASRYEKSGQRVILLAYHVDYWDHLGWKDAFGDPAFSERQSAYSQSLKADGVYTPQMIVNGTDAFVGSDRRKAATSIDAALKQNGGGSLSLILSASSKEQVAAKFKLQSGDEKAVIVVALVQREASSKVTRGENRGSTLKHRNIVRSLQTVRDLKDGEGQATLILPPGIDRKNLSVIAFAQEGGFKKIVAAAESSLPEPRAKE